MKKKNDYTPMMKQYLEIKEEYKDCILFFRLGDFYEMFFDDAITASRELEITLTGKDCGKEERAPMCGVPFHSADGYIAKLIKKGYKVAICEQVEDPKMAKDIVKRDVIRVVTPGTASSQNALDGEKNNFLASVAMKDSFFGVAFADVSTGEVFVSDGEAESGENSLVTLLASFAPTEIILNSGSAAHAKDIVDLKARHSFFDAYAPDEYFELDKAKENIASQFGKRAAQEAGIYDKELCMMALGGLLSYLYETQKINLSHLTGFKYIESSSHLKIDASSFRNLEITETMREKEKRGSLLGILDRTKTAMGARRLKSWLDRPLTDAKQIKLRSDAVEELYNNFAMREDITEALKKVYDIERILSRVVYGSCNARDFISLRQSLDSLPVIKEALSGCDSHFLDQITTSLDTFADLRLLISCAIVDDPPITVKEGGMIKEGFDAELDQTREILKGGTGIIAGIEAREKERTGIKNLKVAYNRVFGYYIEISKSNLDRVPDDYIRKQTLVGGERFITVELKDLEARVLNARERVNAIEYENFLTVKKAILDALSSLQEAAKLVSVLDALSSLATVAERRGYVKPCVNDGDTIIIKDGRHPVVEANLKDSLFVPNDTYLNISDSRFSIITGPNMAGKSTYMRQTALIVIMAQIGSFVPASECTIGAVDAVFTRVGASDDLASGQSTFMVEMNEVAHILKNATKNSLIILDEIGRGTSTFDGLSIAWAVAEYIADSGHIGAKTLFATHYHELTALEEKIEGVKNYSVAVKKRGDDITFLRKIVKGGTDDSFGIQVALLAGLPSAVTDRAKEVLALIEDGNAPESSPSGDTQRNVTVDEDLKNDILSIDIQTLTPIEALNVLYKLQKKVSEADEN